MMKRLLLFSMLGFFVVVGFFISIGYSHINSASNFECIICHRGDMVPDMVKIQGIPKSYIPGKTYILTVVVTSDMKSMGDVAGGFALEATAGQLIVKDKKNTQISNSILTHTQEGSGLRKWTFQWKAPSEKTNVSITVMAVAANGDYSPFGDKVSADSYMIKPAK